MISSNDFSSPDCNKKTIGHNRLYRPLCDINGRVGTPEVESLPLIYEENENEKENNIHEVTPTRRRIGNKIIAQEEIVPTSSTPLSRKQNTPNKTPKFIPRRNPFDADLISKLHLPICSPSVFNNVASPNKSLEENFDWPIEDISRIKPVLIEEDPDSQYHYDDPETESKLQEAIDTFFKTEKQIVPSPFPTTASRPAVFLGGFTSSPKQKAASSLNVATQTALSLPPILPPDLEAALRPYFNQEENDEQDFVRHYEIEEEEEFNISSSGLRRKLMFQITESLHSPNSSPLQSGKWRDGLSRSNKQVSRDLRSPTISPIARSSEDENSPIIAMIEGSEVQVANNMTMDMSCYSNPATPVTRRQSMLITEQKGWSFRQRLLIEEDQSMDSCHGTPIQGNSPQNVALSNITDNGYHTDSKACSGFWGSTKE